jgi:PmbA protein
MAKELQSATDLKQVVRDVMERALRAGATDAEAVAYEGDEFSVLVRLGQVETLQQSGSRAVGLRVFNGLRAASTSSSDLSPDGLRKLVEGAVALAKITSEDPFVGLPEAAEFGQLEGDLALYFEDVNEQDPAERIEIARRCEAAAMAVDTRIQNSGGGDFDASTARKVMVNSRGFLGESQRSYCGFSAAPIAHDEHGRMQRNFWYSSARTRALLESPEEIGRIAAERTLRRL